MLVGKRLRKLGVRLNARRGGRIMAIIFRSRREWRIERLGRIYSVDFVQEGTRFEGRYLGIDNSSVFKGEVLTG